MDIQKLLYFKHVADCGSVSKAAKQLFVAQPSLSQSIKKIEDDVGVPLFRRTPNGILLTYAGERYYLMVSQVLKLYENFQAEISSINDLQSGTLSFGFTSPISKKVLPPIFPLFKKTYPNIKVDIQIGNSHMLKDMLLYGKIDFAVIHSGSAEDTGAFIYQPVLKTPFVIIASPDDPIKEKAENVEGYRFPVLDPRFLKESTFLMVEQGQHKTMITENVLRKAGIPDPKIEMTLRDHTLIYEMVRAGFGVSIMPYETLGHIQRKNAVAYYSIPRSYEATWDICIVTAKNMTLSKIDEKFIEMTTDSILSEYSKYVD